MSETSRSGIRLLKLDESGSGSTDTQESFVPRRCTLRGFAEEVADLGGFSVEQLDPITPLMVRTENTLYRITILEPRGHKILVQGGTYFPRTTTAHLEGSSFGGSLLKQGWIAPGLRMEICSEGTRVVTSKVRSLEIEQDRALPGPF
jgi:hypothetical protein